jgi:hypothetical protein
MIVLIALTLTVGAAAQQRQRQPAPPPLPKQPVTTDPAAAGPYDKLPPRDQELVRMVQLQVAQQIEQIRTGQARQRDRAQATILHLHRQLLVPLDAGRNRGISLRDANRILADWAREIRLARLGAELGPDAVARLRKFRDAKPDILDRLIADDPQTQLEGFRLLHQWPDPSRLAEPLIQRALRDHPDLAWQAVLLLHKNRYISPATLDGLLLTFDNCSAMLQHPEQTPQSIRATTILRDQILQVLPKFDDPRLSPILLQGLLDSPSASLAGPTIDWLTRRNALGAVPVLMDHLHDDAPVTTVRNPNAEPYTHTANDALLYGVLKMTDQPFADYDLNVKTHPTTGHVHTIGFADDQTRKAAIEKLRSWWVDHRDKPPYNKTEPIIMRNYGIKETVSD